MWGIIQIIKNTNFEIIEWSLIESITEILIKVSNLKAKSNWWIGQSKWWFR